MKLMNILKEESMSVPEANHTGKVTSEKLSSLITYFRYDIRELHIVSLFTMWKTSSY